MTVLARSGVAVPLTGTTDETDLAVVVVPANAMGPNGQLRVTSWWSNNNSGNAKTRRVRLEAGEVMAASNSTQVSAQDQRIIANRNNVASQIVSAAAGAHFGGAAGALSTLTVDTAAAANLRFTGQLANAGDTITLEGYLVELIPG
jgi:hypothetical protein